MATRFYPLVSPKILFLFLCFLLLAVQLNLSEAAEEEEEEKTQGHRHVRAEQKRCKGKIAYPCVPLGCSACSMYASADSEEEGTPYCKCPFEIEEKDLTKYDCSTVKEVPDTKPSNVKDITAENCAYMCSQVNEKNPDKTVVATFCKAVPPEFGEGTTPACACTPPPKEPPTTTEATSTTDDTIAIIINLLQLIMNALVTFVEDLVKAVQAFIASLGGLVDLLKNLVPKVLQPVLNAVTGVTGL